MWIDFYTFSLTLFSLLFFCLFVAFSNLNYRNHFTSRHIFCHFSAVFFFSTKEISTHTYIRAKNWLFSFFFLKKFYPPLALPPHSNANECAHIEARRHLGMASMPEKKVFRARVLDPNKRLEVRIRQKCRQQSPKVKRAVAVPPSGMEKEEEMVRF